MTKWELRHTSAAYEWKEPYLDTGRAMATKLRGAIEAMNIDTAAAGAKIEDWQLAAIGDAARRLEAILSRTDDSERLLAFALTDYIQQNEELINSRVPLGR